MYAPIAGEVTAINDDLLDDPSLINVDKYGTGWLLEMSGTDDGGLLTPEKYLEHLASAWEVAQRTIKGQANTED
jgi:glycine cleavage system H protein